jgi:hypothetical protein
MVGFTTFFPYSKISLLFQRFWKYYVNIRLASSLLVEASDQDIQFMMFNATFNNISVIPWWSVLLVEETGYGLPDPGLQREYDIKVNLKMASVRYVHTNRFQSELIHLA